MARIGGNAWLMDSARLLTAKAVDLGEKPSVLSAILKYHLTERGRECIQHAMDVHGGKGIIMGPNNYLGRNWQGAPIFITVEGANILSRNLMIFGQGAIRCHPFVLREMALAGREDRDQALREFDDLLMKHIMFAVGNAASTLIFGLGLGRLEKVPGDALSQGYFRALNRQAAAFALLADLSMMLLGGALKRRERLSARLGDVLSTCTCRRPRSSATTTWLAGTYAATAALGHGREPGPGRTCAGPSAGQLPQPFRRLCAAGAGVPVWPTSHRPER